MKTTIAIFTFFIGILSLQSCVKSEQDDEATLNMYFLKDHIQEHQIQDVRLADGAPITLDITYRWSVAHPDSFKNQFLQPQLFDSLVLKPRAEEITDLTSVKFLSIDSVFTSKRETFVQTIRQELLFGLGGNEANIKEVIITNLTFPSKYTKALEDISLKKKEIERIKQQSLVDLAQADANKKKATLNGQVQIAKAESEGKLAKIKAGTEKNRRSSQLAQAETQSQVQQIQASAQARTREIALQVELENERKQKELQRQDLLQRNNLDIQKEREVQNLALQTEKKKQEQQLILDRQQRQFDFEMEVTFAELCAANPRYAEYLVNKELASQVEIAILPTGSELAVFEDVIKKTMTTRQ